MVHAQAARVWATHDVLQAAAQALCVVCAERIKLLRLLHKRGARGRAARIEAEFAAQLSRELPRALLDARVVSEEADALVAKVVACEHVWRRLQARGEELGPAHHERVQAATLAGIKAVLDQLDQAQVGVLVAEGTRIGSACGRFSHTHFNVHLHGAFACALKVVQPSFLRGSPSCMGLSRALGRVCMHRFLRGIFSVQRQTHGQAPGELMDSNPVSHCI